MPHDPIWFENCISNSGPKSLSILQLLNTLSLLPHILTYLSHLPYFSSHHFSIQSAALQDPVLGSQQHFLEVGRNTMTISTLVFVCPDQGCLKGLRWLELWRSHVSSKIPAKNMTSLDMEGMCSLLHPQVLAEQSVPLYMNKINFKRVFKNPKSISPKFISPAKLLRQRAKTIGQIGRAHV